MAIVDKPTEAKPKYKVIGTRPIRHDGVDKVTGRAKYGADIQLTGMLYGKILRSPHAHARIKSIDTSKAEQAPGVHAVITSKDMPEIGSKIADLGEGMFDLKDLTRIVLAREKVVYKGHAVAAVAAETIHQAEAAALLIEVDYEPLPPVLDVRAAMQDDAPILHEDLRTKAFASATDDPGEKPTNIAKHFQHEKGDVEKGFADAKLVVEREFTTATVHQGYIEPHVATALWNTPPVAALLSKKSGRPVKVVMDRAAVLEATGPTPGSYMRVKIGVDAEGSITAAEAYLVFEAGGFPGSPIPAACMTVFACYDVPNGLVNGYDVCNNKPASKAYRAPGATHAAFAVETIVDEICEELKIDPLEFRLKNAAVEGTRRVDGVLFPRVGMVETVEAWGRGRFLACNRYCLFGR